MKKLLLGLGLGLTACTTSADRADSRDASADGGTVDLATLATRKVDTLTAREARTLCAEDARRFDPCMARAIIEQTQSACDAVLTTCRQDVSASGATSVSCENYDLGPPGSCSVSVEEYMTCADAWNAMQTCTNAGKYLVTPSSCDIVVRHCPRLAAVFSRDGTPPPCASDAATPPAEAVHDDLYGFDGCKPPPERLVILGDSIAACSVVRPEDCGPLLLGEYLKATVAPNVVTESFASYGARIAGLPDEARQVEPGPGPVLVLAYILGNDLAARDVSDAGVADAFRTTFEYFGDRSRFPGGVTFMLNTQYSPYDQCPKPLGNGFGISDPAEAWLRQVNHDVFIVLAEDRPDTVTIDQYPDWLGHGANANTFGCPHCGRDNTLWMAPDKIHPNALGYAHMLSKWRQAVDRMYGPSCHSG